MRKHAFFSNLLSGPKGPSKFQPWANSETNKPVTTNKPSSLGPHVVHPNTRKHIENGSYTPTYQTTPGSYFDTSAPRAIPIDESTTAPVVPRQPSTAGTTKGPNGWQLSPEALNMFRKGTASQYDPNSRVDRAKMEALMNGNSDWAVRKSAFIKKSSMVQDDEKTKKKTRNKAIIAGILGLGVGGAAGGALGLMGGERVGKLKEGNRIMDSLKGSLNKSTAGLLPPAIQDKITGNLQHELDLPKDGTKTSPGIK